MLVKFNLLFLVLTLFVGYIIFYSTKLLNKQIFKTESTSSYLKAGLITALFVSGSSQIICFIAYCNFYAKLAQYTLCEKFFIVPNLNFSYNFSLTSWITNNLLNTENTAHTFFNIINYEILNFSFSFDFFGFILLILAYIVGFFSLFALDTRLY
jgi:hypothetical protein